MNNQTQTNKSIIEKIKNNKKLQIILIIVLSIIVVGIFVSNFFVNDEAEPETNAINEYVYNLEKRLENTLSQVEGAGAVSVVITIESGMETVLAMEKVVKETETTTEIKETPVIINGKPIILKEQYPKIIGVIIVAKGANNIAVMSKIQQATISLLDININQIEILTMK
ncbi:MAG: hypothetical protein IJX16_02540 [Clostridia bacterium]|nr:hypothetical protein [Clostridia bacterium]